MGRQRAVARRVGIGKPAGDRETHTHLALEVAMTATMVFQSRATGWRRSMTVACTAFALVLAALYVGGPFITLWRVTRAVEVGDPSPLRGLIDWNAVRQGLRDDVTEGIVGIPQRRLIASNTLPPFGSGFISGIAGSEIDHSVTPQALLEVSRQLHEGSAGDGFALFSAVVGARFTSPTRFELTLRVPCPDADNEQPLHVRLAFHRGLWRVIRVWVPQDLMDMAASHG
jgi:hypothetical protein